MSFFLFFSYTIGEQEGGTGPAQWGRRGTCGRRRKWGKDV
jgi:hypothetical protein